MQSEGQLIPVYLCRDLLQPVVKEVVVSFLRNGELFSVFLQRPEGHHLHVGVDVEERERVKLHIYLTKGYLEMHRGKGARA